jgi:Restriction Enzyme Adenine Methylase Associated
MSTGRSPISLADLMQAGLLRSGQHVWFRRNKKQTATLTTAGTLLLAGKEYGNPSAAGVAASGGTATNGWLAWYVEDDGGITDLDGLRQRLKLGQ